MKIYIFAAILIALAFLTLPVSAGNALTNPGFETGTTSGWTLGEAGPNIASGGAHTGTYLCQASNYYLTHTPFDQSISQTVYSNGATAYVYLSEGSTYGERLWVDSAYTDYTGSGSGAWVYRTFPAHSAGVHTFKISAVPNGSTSWLADDAYVEYGGGPVSPPVANFTTSQNSGTLTMQFTDNSTNTPTSWAWNFGDAGTSTSQNPAHSYSSSGTYAVNLTATNSGGSSSKTLWVVVINPITPPTAAFSLSPSTGSEPLTVSFTDISSNTPTSWEWIFGNNGTFIDSTAANPTWTYSVGTYTVNHSATNAGGTRWANYTYAVSVTQSTSGSYFTATPVNGTAPLTVQFNDTTNNSVAPYHNSQHWIFGDGADRSCIPEWPIGVLVDIYGMTSDGAVTYDSAYDQSSDWFAKCVQPSYTYQKAGSYQATLQVGETIASALTNWRSVSSPRTIIVTSNNASPVNVNKAFQVTVFTDYGLPTKYEYWVEDNQGNKTDPNIPMTSTIGWITIHGYDLDKSVPKPIELVVGRNYTLTTTATMYGNPYATWNYNVDKTNFQYVAYLQTVNVYLKAISTNITPTDIPTYLPTTYPITPTVTPTTFPTITPTTHPSGIMTTPTNLPNFTPTATPVTDTGIKDFWNGWGSYIIGLLILGTIVGVVLKK